MKKRFLALILTLAAVLSLLPATAVPALADEVVEQHRVRLIKAVSTGFSHYIVYELDGVEYRSCDQAANFNFHAWQMMNDTDKREAARAFVAYNYKLEAFGQEGAQAVVDFINEKSGWTKAIEQFRWKIEKKYNDPELVKAFSDHVPTGNDANGNPNTKTWYELTMEEQFTAAGDMADVIHRDEVSELANTIRKEIEASRAAMEIGHQFYQSLSKYRNMAMDIAVKSGSKEIISIILDRFMFPTAPSGMASSLAGATGSLVNELTNIYLQVSGIQSAVTESIYGEQPDPSVCLKYVNAMADLMELGCQRALAGARSSWQSAENHTREMVRLIDKFTADQAEAFEEMKEKITEAEEPEVTPTHADENQIISSVKPASGGPPKRENYDTETQYDNARIAYQDGLMAKARQWAEERDKLIAKRDAYEADFQAWKDGQPDRLEALLDDGVPSFVGEYDSRWDDDYWFKYPDITDEEVAEREAAVKAMKDYLLAMKSYVAAHNQRAQRLFDEEKEKYAEFCRRYEDLQLAAHAYNQQCNQNIPGDYEWYGGTAAYNSVYFTYALRDWYVSLPQPSDSFTVTVYVANLPRYFPYDYLFNYMGGVAGGTDNGEKNAVKSKDIRGSAYGGHGNYFDVLQGEISDLTTIYERVDNMIARSESFLAGLKKSRAKFTENMNQDIALYNTARDNYELARKFYIDAVNDEHQLMASAPDYVKSQYYNTWMPDRLWAEGEHRNNVLFNMLKDAKDRPALVKQIGARMKSMYDRHLQNTAKMKYAREQMEECQKVMREYGDQLERFMVTDPGLGRDLGLTYVSPGIGPEWEWPYWPYVGILTQTYGLTSDEIRYGNVIRLLYQDFNGISEYLAEGKNCTHLLRVNTPKILREWNSGSTKTLNAINTRYQKAVSSAQYYSWVRFDGPWGDQYEPYDTLYAQIRQILYDEGGRTSVTGIRKGSARSAGLLAEPDYDLTLSPGGSGTLSVTVEPANAYDTSVTWVSRTPEIATVDQNGRVTAVSSGDAVIIAYPNDSFLVPVDTEGNILDISTDANTYGDPVIPEGKVFGGYIHALQDNYLSDPFSAEMEFKVHVADDPALGLWSRVSAYEGVYDGGGHIAVNAAGLENEEVVVEYSTDGENWDLCCPTVTDAGTLTVQVRLTAGSLPELPPDAESWEYVYVPPESEEPEEPGEGEEEAQLSEAVQTQTKTFTARVTPMSLTGKEISVLFGQQALVDGQAHNVVIDMVTADGVTIPAGSYTVASGGSATAVMEQSVTVTGSGNFTGTSGASQETWRLRKPTPTAEDFTYAIPQDAAYTGAGIGIDTPKANVTGMGAMTVKYNGLTTLPVNAGDYAVTLDVEEGAGYEAEYGLALGTLTVAKGEYTGPKSYAYTFPLEVVDSEEFPYPANKDWYTFVFPRLASSSMKLAEMTVVDPDGLLRATNGWDDGSTTWYFQAKVNSTDAPAQATITVPFTGGANYNDYAVTFTVRSAAEPVNYKASVSYSTYSKQASYSVSCDNVTEDTPIQVVVGQYVGSQMKAAKSEIITLTAESKNAGGYLDFAETPGAIYKLFLLDPVSHAPLSTAW